MKRILKFIVLPLFSVLTSNVNAQITYTENFENGMGGWTGTYTMSSLNPCEASFSVRDNIYTLSGGHLTSGIIGASNGGQITLDFMYKIINWSGGGATSANFGTTEIQYSSSSTGPWITAHTIDANNHTPSTTCSTVSLTFTPPTGDMFIRFYTTYNAGDYWFYIDDISISQGPPPSCPGPSALTTSNILGNSADIGWTTGGATNWNIEYGPAGFTQGTGTMVTNVSNPYSITGLSGLTDYDVYVQDSCGVGDVSIWNSTSFSTPCAAYIPVYLESFNSFLPTCWDEASDGDPNTGPTSLGFGNWGSDGFLNNGTSGAARINLYATGTRDWLISSEFDLSGTTLWELSVDFGVTTYHGTNTSNMGSDDEVIVLITENGGTSWDTLEIINASSTPSNTGETRLYDLSTYTSTVRFGFWANDGTVNDPEDYDFFIDNFDIHELPPCAMPTALSVSNISDSSASITWTPGGSTNWNIEYGPSGFTQGTGTLITNVSNPYSLTGLSALSNYDVYVQDSCLAGYVSNWEVVSFSTPCAAYIPVYMENFNSFLPTCWDEASDGNPNAGPTSLGLGRWDSDGFLNNGTSGSARINLHGTNTKDWLISPEFDLSGTTLWELGFDMGVTHYSTNAPSNMGSDDEVILLITSDRGLTWDTLQVINIINAPTNNGETKLLNLSNYNSIVQFAFWANDGTVNDPEDYNFYIDNFNIHELPSCPQPANIIVSNLTTNSADIGWTTGGATNWNIEYGPAGFTQGTGTYLANVANPYSLSMLTAITDYDVYIQDSCGVGDVSNWEMKRFTTLPGAHLFPLYEDFEDSTLFFENKGSSGTSWILTNTLAYSGAQCVYNAYNENDDNVLHETGILDLSGTGLPILEFWHIAKLEGCCDKAYVEVSTDGGMSYVPLPDSLYRGTGDYTNIFNEYSYTEWIGFQNVNNTHWKKEQFVLTPYAVPDVRFRFRLTSDGSVEDEGWYIDDIHIYAPTCPEPFAISSSYASMDSIVLNWNAGYQETMWNIEYGEAGFTQGTGTVVVATDTTDTIVGLNLGTVYQFYVQADCGNGDVSNWIGPFIYATDILNDSTCDATIVTPNTDFSPRFYSNIGATIQTNESSLAGSHYNTVWFKTVVPASGHLLIATCGSDFYSVVGAYSYDTLICDSVETYGQIASNTSNFGVCGVANRGSIEICGATPGDTVLFYVGGGSASQSGIISLIVSDYGLDGYAGEGPQMPLSVCTGDTIDLWSQLSNELTNRGEWVYEPNSSAIVNDSTANTGAFTLVGNEVYYIVSHTCDADTAVVEVDVVTAANSGTALSNFQACSNGDVFLFGGLTGTVDVGGVWSDDTDTGLLNGDKFVANGLPDGTYQFTYTVDNGICLPSSTQITVNLVDCTSIEEGEVATFNIYPNPNSGLFYIANNAKSDVVEVKVLNVQGKIIYQKNHAMVEGIQQEVSVENIESGVYLVQIISNHQVFTTTIIVQ